MIGILLKLNLLKWLLHFYSTAYVAPYPVLVLVKVLICLQLTSKIPCELPFPRHLPWQAPVLANYLILLIYFLCLYILEFTWLIFIPGSYSYSQIWNSSLNQPLSFCLGCVIHHPNIYPFSIFCDFYFPILCEFNNLSFSVPWYCTIYIPCSTILLFQ